MTARRKLKARLTPHLGMGWSANIHDTDAGVSAFCSAPTKLRAQELLRECLDDGYPGWRERYRLTYVYGVAKL